MTGKGGLRGSFVRHVGVCVAGDSKAGQKHTMSLTQGSKVFYADYSFYSTSCLV